MDVVDALDGERADGEQTDTWTCGRQKDLNMDVWAMKGPTYGRVDDKET